MSGLHGPEIAWNTFLPTGYCLEPRHPSFSIGMDSSLFLTQAAWCLIWQMWVAWIHFCLYSIIFSTEMDLLPLSLRILWTISWGVCPSTVALFSICTCTSKAWPRVPHPVMRHLSLWPTKLLLLLCFHICKEWKKISLPWREKYPCKVGRESVNDRQSLFEPLSVLSEKCHTLASVLNQLEDYLSDLDLLNRLMTNGISSCKHMTSASQRTITLLQETHILLLEVDALGESHVRQVLLVSSSSLNFPKWFSWVHCPLQLTFLLNLWIKILRPYVEIIDNWISYGNLQDFHHEFIIRRSVSSTAFLGIILNLLATFYLINLPYFKEFSLSLLLPCHSLIHFNATKS